MLEASYQSHEYNFGTRDLFLATVPPYHIYGFLFSVLIPFISSSRVLKGIYTYPEEIRKGLQEQDPSVLISIPLHYKTLRDCKTQCKNLKIAFSSAGKLDYRDSLSFSENSQTNLVEIYGSTETGGIASRWHNMGEDHFKPFKLIDWKIVSSVLRIRSPFIAPSAPRDSEGFFTTGDRAEHKTGDTFQLLGRSDGIVKIGGKRVDLTRIESRFKSIPGVEEAVALALPGEPEKQICVIIKGDKNNLEDVRERASLKLEAVAFPKSIIILQELPTLNTGKYDRKALEKICIQKNS